eukprot:389347_1
MQKKSVEMNLRSGRLLSPRDTGTNKKRKKENPQLMSRPGAVDFGANVVSFLPTGDQQQFISTGNTQQMMFDNAWEMGMIPARARVIGPHGRWVPMDIHSVELRDDDEDDDDDEVAPLGHPDNCTGFSDLEINMK